MIRLGHDAYNLVDTASEVTFPWQAADFLKISMFGAKSGVDTGFQGGFIRSRTCLSPVLFGAKLFVTLGCFSPVCTFKLMSFNRLVMPTFWGGVASLP